MAGLYGISFWLPTLVSNLGITSPLKIGALTAIPYGVAAIGMVFVGRSADRRGEHRWHIAIPALLGALGLVLSVKLSGNTTLALAALTLATFGILTAAPLFWNLPTAYLSGAAAAGGIAIINSSGNLAGFTTPYAIGWIKDATGSTDIGTYVLAASLVLAVMLVGVSRK